MRYIFIFFSLVLTSAFSFVPAASAFMVNGNVVHPIMDAGGNLIFPAAEPFELEDIDFSAYDRGYYGYKLLLWFTKTGAPNASGLDNHPLADSEFDFRAYLSHQCYGVKGTNVTLQCLREFGPYADLRETLENGTLDRLISGDAFLGNNDQKMDEDKLNTTVEMLEERLPTSIVDDNRGPADEYVPEDNDMTSNIRSRAEFVWNICQARFDSDHAKACYAANLRTVSDVSIPLNGDNVVYGQ